MKKLLAMLTAAVLCMAALTACGSDEAPANAGSQDNNTGSQAAGNRPVLVVGTNAEFPPFEYVGDDGEPDGFDVALIRAIADKMGMDVQIENIEFDSLVAAIGTKLDAAIAGMSITEERLAEVDFSDEYYEAVQYVVVPAGSDISAAADLEGKSIGVQLGTTGNNIADEIAEKSGGTSVQTYNKAVDAVNDLVNGRVDVVIIDKNPAEVFAEQFSGQVEIIDGAQFDFEPEFYAIALPKGSDMVEKVNAALAELKADGTFDALVAEYIQ